MKEEVQRIFMNVLDILQYSANRLDYLMSRWDSILKSSAQAVRWFMDIGFQLLYAERELGKLEQIPNIRENLRAKLYILLYDHIVPSLDKSYNQFERVIKIAEEIKDNINRVEKLLNKWERIKDPANTYYQVIDFIRLIIKSLQEIIEMYKKSFEIKTIIRNEIVNNMPPTVELTNYFTVWRIEPSIRPDLIQRARQEIDDNLGYLRSFLNDHLPKAMYLNYDYEQQENKTKKSWTRYFK
ncbi:MAG: hypothetical protein ACP6IU_01160 [Candidatus Asgardarchaeia archaeon]